MARTTWGASPEIHAAAPPLLPPGSCRTSDRVRLRRREVCGSLPAATGRRPGTEAQRASMRQPSIGLIGPPPSSGAPSPSAAGPLSRHSSCRADPLCPPQRAVVAHKLRDEGGCVARPRSAGPSVGICRGTQGRGQFREPPYRQQVLRALGPSLADLGGPSRATQMLSARFCRQTSTQIALCVTFCGQNTNTYGLRDSAGGTPRSKQLEFE